MDEQEAELVLETLAQLVVYYGEENTSAHCKRLERARKVLKRIAPDVLARVGKQCRPERMR